MKILVSFCSLTGNNEDIAEYITDNLALQNNCQELEMQDVTKFDIENADILICVTFTYESSLVPEEAQSFFNTLSGFASLRGKSFFCAGSGDLYYGEDFCKSVKSFEKLLLNKSANQLMPNVYVDQELKEIDKRKLDNLTKIINS